MTVVLPYKFQPRPYQLPVLKALDSGYNRAVAVWHRRSGKDKTFLNLVIKKMYERVGTYWYIFPTYNQAKKVIWDGMDRNGFKFTDHFPPEIIKRKDSTNLMIETKNGSVFQLIGSDNIDSLMGGNPIGLVFSEYSLQDPRAWDLLRPILAENGGWAVFEYTPRGSNHGKQLFDAASADPSWFAQKLTVLDTKVLSQDILDKEKAEIVAHHGTDALYQQEYMCSFEVPVEGAYYAKQIMLAEEQGRIRDHIVVEAGFPVDTYWDLGIGDSTAIWFAQTIGGEIRFIDYYETSGEGLVFYAKHLQELPYVYGFHFAPHDIAVRELGTGKTRIETAKSLGIDFSVVERTAIEDGIDAVRTIFGQCYFDATKCARGLDALRSYHKEWDENNKMWKDHPDHDWSSHGADAFRTFAQATKKRYYGVDPALIKQGGVKPYFDNMPG